MNFTKLVLKFTVEKKIPYKQLGTFDREVVEQVLDFAYQMSFGGGGEHKKNRSGSDKIRTNGEIFANTFQGKLSEFAVYNQLNNGISITPPDLSTNGRGKWDDYDIVIKGKNVSVKSTKRGGNLLLLETDDWDENGHYIHNIEKGSAAYDLFVLVRIDPSCEGIMRRERLLYTETQSKETLSRLVTPNSWNYDIPGFITKTELQYVIKNKYIINKDSVLSGSKETIMEAENYYVQAGDMHQLSEIGKFL